METWAPIRYKGFWDVPLVFLVPYQRQWFLFDCPFDEGKEEYAEDYNVYLVPEFRPEDLPADWTTLHQKAISFLGRIPVKQIRFDSSRRKEIDVSVIDPMRGLVAARKC